MKIIQVIPDLGVGGAEIMCETLTMELIKKGHQIIIVSLFECDTMITKRLINNGIDLRFLGKKIGLDLSMIFKLKKIFIDEKPDVVHTHRNSLQYAAIACQLSGINCKIHTVHSIAKKEQVKISRIFSKLLYKYCDVIPVALSHEIQSTIIDEYDLKKEKVPIILNGVDLSRCIKKLDYNLNKPINILHIGRFSKVKNHKCLVEAFEEFCEIYSNSKLMLIGDGEERKEIEEFIKSKNIADKIQFLGLKENVYPYIHEADIFVLPSIYEGIPISLIEAMGTGVPIVATAVGGIPDMLQNNVSALLTKVNSKKISDAFIKYANDFNLRRKCGEEAYKESFRFSSKEMAKKYIELYRKRCE